MKPVAEVAHSFIITTGTMPPSFITTKGIYSSPADPKEDFMPLLHNASFSVIEFGDHL